MSEQVVERVITFTRRSINKLRNETKVEAGDDRRHEEKN